MVRAVLSDCGIQPYAVLFNETYHLVLGFVICGTVRTVGYHSSESKRVEYMTVSYGYSINRRIFNNFLDATYDYYSSNVIVVTDDYLFNHNGLIYQVKRHSNYGGYPNYNVLT